MLFNGIVSVCGAGSLYSDLSVLQRLCAARRSIVCSNGVETEAMLEHGGTGGRSCYKTCHSLSSSRQQPMLQRFPALYKRM